MRPIDAFIPAVLLLVSAAARADPPPSSSTPPPSVMDVRSPARTALLAVGDAVPSFRAVAHDGRVVDVGPGTRPDAVVVYFYPMDDTPG